MKPCHELMKIIDPAYAPCVYFKGACQSLRWAPECGHIPRGYLGATGSLEEVRLVLVFAEPGDPHDSKRRETMSTSLEYTYQCMKNGTDRFHRNVRLILDLCFPEDPFDAQLRKTWMTESLLCSAPKESGAVTATAWRTCSATYLKPQLALLPNAVVVALGAKARTRLASLGVPYMEAAAAAPPGCNFKGAVESWHKVAAALCQ
jgi:hypothetical protein